MDLASKLQKVESDLHLNFVDCFCVGAIFMISKINTLAV